MELAITKISDKGQIVIPKQVRESMGLLEGNRLLVISDGESIVLQKVEVLGDKWKIKDLVDKTKEILMKVGIRI